jgi:tripartite-type tricarboxylate transporter receptor subunit TctC
MASTSRRQSATRTSRRLALAVAGAALLAPLAGAFAEDDKSPIRLLVGLAPGGSNDVAARILADQLATLLGRPVIVENRLGAGQRLALAELRRSAPDGRTLILATNSPFTIYPHIYSKLDYDPVKDFTPVAGVTRFDIGFATGPLTGSTDLRQWIAWAKENPQRASYGTPGAGTLPQFLGVAFGQALGLDMPMVPYKGGAVALTDLVGGHLPLLIDGLSDMTEMHRAGKIHVIAVAGDARSPLLPDVPTLKERGIDITSVITVGIFGPAKLPADVLRKLNAAITAAVRSPEVVERFSRNGLIAAPATPQELAATLAAESARLAVLVKASGYVAE